MRHWISIASMKPSGGDDLAAVRRLPDGAFLAVLADGATGGGDGRAAAQAFLDGAFSRITSSRRPGVLARVIVEIDKEMPQRGFESDTTGVIALIQNGLVSVASAGDSEAWLLAPDGPVELTAGQSRKPRVGSGVGRPHRAGPEPLSGILILGSDGLFRGFDRSWIWNAVLGARLILPPVSKRLSAHATTGACRTIFRRSS